MSYNIYNGPRGLCFKFGLSIKCYIYALKSLHGEKIVI